ncbi:MAG: hypothetical protein K1X64_04480 [Myxococcaceae bacterium]|nr:hypothetical protein [Myxococcaceae bacterium]
MSDLVLGSSLKEFFRLLVGDAVNRQRVSLGEVTEFYLVNLLSEFAAAEKLFTEELDGKKETEALAILYHRALQQEREEKIKTLRRLGDVSLYTAGFFPDSLRDRAVGSDYYIQMGGSAYAQLAQLSQHSSFASVYWELHQKFRSLVEVLEEISARGMCAAGPQGTVKVFENYARTGSGHLEQVLVEAGLVVPKGILPN